MTLATAARKSSAKSTARADAQVCPDRDTPDMA